MQKQCPGASSHVIHDSKHDFLLHRLLKGDLIFVEKNLMQLRNTIHLPHFCPTAISPTFIKAVTAKQCHRLWIHYFLQNYFLHLNYFLPLNAWTLRTNSFTFC